MTCRVSSQCTQSDHSQDKLCLSEILQTNVFVYLISTIQERSNTDKFQSKWLQSWEKKGPDHVQNPIHIASQLVNRDAHLIICLIAKLQPSQVLSSLFLQYQHNIKTTKWGFKQYLLLINNTMSTQQHQKRRLKWSCVCTTQTDAIAFEALSQNYSPSHLFACLWEAALSKLCHANVIIFTITKLTDLTTSFSLHW